MRAVLTITSKALRLAHVKEGSHSFTCHPHVYPQFLVRPRPVSIRWVEWARSCVYSPLTRRRALPHFGDIKRTRYLITCGAVAVQPRCCRHHCKNNLIRDSAAWSLFLNKLMDEYCSISQWLCKRRGIIYSYDTAIKTAAICSKSDNLVIGSRLPKKHSTLLIWLHKIFRLLIISAFSSRTVVFGATIFTARAMLALQALY